jgi:hypothetical protein
MEMNMKHPKVLDWSDERRMGNPIMVTTAYGWAFEPADDHESACHVRGFDNVREFRSYAKWIKPCSCLRCTSFGKEA